MSRPPLRRPLAAAPAPQPAPVAAAPVSDPNSPLGVWATEENKGNVRIEAVRRQSLRLCRQDRRKDPDQHEAGWREVDRPDPRSRQRPQLRLDDRDEGQQYAARAGLRLRRHVLRRPDLEARELIHLSKSIKGPVARHRALFAFSTVNIR